MPTGIIPVNSKAYQNVDEVSLHTQATEIVDAYVDEAGATVGRPGLTTWATLPGTSGQAIDGLYWWQSQKVTIGVRDGRVHKIAQDGTVTELTGANLLKGTRVTFADNGSTLIMVNGSTLVSTDNLTTSYITDPQAPTAATHVVFMDQYIIANDTSSGNEDFIVWSDVGDPTSWTALSSASPEGLPDNVNGVFTSHREIVITGEQSIELWYNDGVSPFRRIDGAFIQHGVIAPYTMKYVHELNSWIWLDHQRRLVTLNGRVPQIKSMPFDKTIQRLSTVADATGDLLRVDGRTFYLLSFPTENITFCYDFVLDSWSQWGSWDIVNGEYDKYLGGIAEFALTWGFHLVGSSVDGEIYKGDATAYTDSTSNNPIRPKLKTGWIDHNTHLRKSCVRLTIKLKRGVGQSDLTDPELMYRYRSDNGEWSNEDTVSLGTTGDNEYIMYLWAKGSYRSRQWEFSLSDPTAFNIVSIHEDFKLFTR